MNAIKMSIATVIIAIICLFSLADSTHLEEVCQWETFEAHCADNEVIVMKEARYGRMKVGKCIPRNYMVGCSADVTEYMHGRCSGQQHCRVPVPDPIMFKAQPCAKDLVAYLQAEYECVKVAKWDKESCDKVMTADSGLIAKPADSVEDIRQKHHCPRRIVAQPGQTINVYLSDFFDKYQEDEPSFNTVTPLRNCIMYGHIAEEGPAVPTGICGGEYKNEQLVYRSKSNVIDITLTAPSSHSHHYLIKYEVVGCPTLHAPKNGWIDFQTDKAIIHCNNSHTASELVCRGNRWIGQMNNCTSHDMPIMMPISGSLEGPSANTGLMVAVVIGVAFGVAVAVVLLVFASKRSKKAEAVPQIATEQQPQHQVTTGSDLYMSLPVVDPNYIPVSAEDGSKTFMPSNPVHHIVNHLYDAPTSGEFRIDLANSNIYTL